MSVQPSHSATRAGDRHRTRRRPDDPSADPNVEADPGVERQAVGPGPAGVALDRDRRISLLVGRPDAGDEGPIAACRRDRPHRSDHETRQSVTLAGGRDDDLERPERVSRPTRHEAGDRPLELVVPALRQVRVGAVPRDRRGVEGRDDGAVAVDRGRPGTARTPRTGGASVRPATGSSSMKSGQTTTLWSPIGPRRRGVLGERDEPMPRREGEARPESSLDPPAGRCDRYCSISTTTVPARRSAQPRRRESIRIQAKPR